MVQRSDAGAVKLLQDQSQEAIVHDQNQEAIAHDLRIHLNLRHVKAKLMKLIRKRPKKTHLRKALVLQKI